MENEYIKENMENIIYNCDNVELLKVVNYLVGVVVNDIENMNDLINEKDYYDLGGNYMIKNEDLESLVSITETIDNITKYNKEEEKEIEVI